MSSSFRFIQRNVAGVDARTLARRTVAEDRAEVERVVRTSRERFDREMTLRAGHHHLQLGATPRGGRYAISSRELSAMRCLVTGMPGNGKSMTAIAFGAWCAERALIERDVSVFALSPKPDLADGIVRLLARRLRRLQPRARAEAIERVQIFAPFRRTRGWALLEPQPGISVTSHAAVVGDALMAIRGFHLGEVQLPTLRALLVLAICEKWSVLELLFHVYDPGRIAAAAKRCPEVETRLFLQQRYARLGRGVVDGIAARLRLLQGSEAIKAVFARIAPPFDMVRALEPGNVSLVSTADSPLGSEGASQAMNAIVLSAGLGYSMFDPKRRATGTTLVIVDEAHVPAAVPSAAEVLSAALSRGRAANIAAILICQAEAQFDSRMREVFAASINTRIVFAGSAADMTAARTWITPTGAAPRPLRPGERPSPELSLLSSSDEEIALARELGAMPPRHCLVAERYQSFTSQIIRTRDLAIPTDDELDPDIMHALEERAGLPLDEAVRRVRATEEELAARFDVDGVVREAIASAPPTRGAGPKGGAL